MIPRVTLKDIMHAWWSDLSGRAQKEQIARWLAAWGRALKERYAPVVCNMCDGVISQEAFEALPDRFVADRTVFRNPAAPAIIVELASCPTCGWTISRTRKA